MIETVNSVTTPKMRKFLERYDIIYTHKAHPFNFKYIYRYPVPSVFRIMIKLSHDLTLTYDSIDYSAEKILQNKPLTIWSLR